MKKEKWTLFISVIWFLAMTCWITVLYAEIRFHDTSMSRLILHGLCVLVSFAAATANLVRYKRLKKQNY